ARSAVAAPASLALSDAQGRLSYAELDAAITACAHGLLHLGLQRGKRVGIYLDKRRESVIAAFGAARAGGVFVPINPLLKPSQVEHILRDCNVQILITSAERRDVRLPVLSACPDLRHMICLGAEWDALLTAPAGDVHRAIDSDMAAIFYTSGSTGRPTGVML